MCTPRVIVTVLPQLTVGARDTGTGGLPRRRRYGGSHDPGARPWCEHCHDHGEPTSAMSTRMLILVSLLCGVAILVAFTVQILLAT